VPRVADAAKKTTPIIPPIGRYLEAAGSIISTSLIFNIITTNKNRIAIAPTYTIIKRNAKYSAAPFSINNRRAEALANTKIKEKIECTGFVELITINPETVAPRANVQYKNSVIVGTVFSLPPPTLRAPAGPACAAVPLRKGAPKGA
jgi:hypothetical protein